MWIFLTGMNRGLPWILQKLLEASFCCPQKYGKRIILYGRLKEAWWKMGEIFNDLDAYAD